MPAYFTVLIVNLHKNTIPTVTACSKTTPFNREGREVLHQWVTMGTASLLSHKNAVLMPTI